MIHHSMMQQKSNINTPNEYNVVWTDLVGVAANGNSLAKTASDGWGNGGAASSNALSSNADGWAEYSVAGLNFIMFGFSEVNADADFTTIEYAVFTRVNGEIRIYEEGVNLGIFGTYSIGDILRVERIANSVFYKKNGVLLYTSTVSSSSALIVDVAMFSGTMNNAIASFDVP